MAPLSCRPTSAKPLNENRCPRSRSPRHPPTTGCPAGIRRAATSIRAYVKPANHQSHPRSGPQDLASPDAERRPRAVSGQPSSPNWRIKSDHVVSRHAGALTGGWRVVKGVRRSGARAVGADVHVGLRAAIQQLTMRVDRGATLQRSCRLNRRGVVGGGGGLGAQRQCKTLTCHLQTNAVHRLAHPPVWDGSSRKFPGYSQARFRSACYHLRLPNTCASLAIFVAYTATVLPSIVLPAPDAKVRSMAHSPVITEPDPVVWPLPM
jgi:hypothetical protein